MKRIIVSIICLFAMVTSYPQTAESEQVFTKVEKMPEYPGGVLAMQLYLQTNIKYPQAANGAEGRILVQFIIDTDGSVTDAKVVKSVNPHLDAEALRVINAMPKWKPGTQKGKAVRVKYTIPINFRHGTTTGMAENQSHNTTTTSKEPSPAVNEKLKAFNVNGVKFNMVIVKGGTFTMGATEEQLEENHDDWEDLGDDEESTHSETVSDFLIGETEVTQELWKAVMGGNPSHFTGSLQLPVEMVSWDDCQKFIQKLNQLTRYEFRLPTEAEWEYAARGGNKTKKYKFSGSNDINEVALYWDEKNSMKYPTKTYPVKAKKPNELGIYDMSGNVHEWCKEVWREFFFNGYYNRYEYDSRVCRGGGHIPNVGGWNLRVSGRYDVKHGSKNQDLGFRLALNKEISSETKSTTGKKRGTIEGHEYVDLGLPSGIKWATCNVGAGSPEKHGNYYAWGETKTKNLYAEENNLTKGKNLQDISGNVTYDVARANWGGTWRTPTRAEMQELQSNCMWEWTQINGVNGVKITGPNGNSIFLPASGAVENTMSNNVGELGLYWSSTSLETSAYGVNFYNGHGSCTGSSETIEQRHCGRTVRPVSE